MNPGPNKYYTGSEDEHIIPDVLHAQAHDCMQVIQYRSRLYTCLHETSSELTSYFVCVGGAL